MLVAGCAQDGDSGVGIAYGHVRENQLDGCPQQPRPKERRTNYRIKLPMA